MLKNKVIINQDAHTTAEAVAKLISEHADKRNQSGEFFNIAISGGSTPSLLFALLAKEYKEKINWAKFRLFWVDERCVEPTDSESNYGVVDNLLLKHIDIPKENVFRMRGEEVPAVEAERYQEVLLNTLPQANGVPQFDMVLLGMGDDGHTASIFPNQMELLHTDDFVSVGQHPVSGQNRITLTGTVICKAVYVAFIITGSSKIKVVEEVIHEKDYFESYPAYYIMSNCDTDIFLDNEAAEKV